MDSSRGFEYGRTILHRPTRRRISTTCSEQVSVLKSAYEEIGESDECR